MPVQICLPTSDVESLEIKAYSSGSTAYNLLASDDGATSDITFHSDDGYIGCGFAAMVPALSISSILVKCKGTSGGGGANVYSNASVYIKIGGTRYYSSSGPVGISNTIQGTWAVNPATSAVWTTVSVNAIQAIGYDVQNYLTADNKPSYLALEVTYIAPAAGIDTVRHVGSVDLFHKGRPEAFASLPGNMDAASVPLLGLWEVEHTAGPHATDLGWESAVYQRRPMAAHGLTIDMNAMTVTPRLKDMRRRVLVRDLAWSDKASGSLLDGIARFSTPGSIFTFTRPASETFTNPVGESESVPANVPGYADGGLQMLAGSSSRYYVTNNTTARTLNAAQGSFQCEVKFTGTLAEDRVIAYCYHDASNYLKLYYDNASGKIKFSLRAEGTTTTVTALAAAANATWYQVGIYWTSFELENGHSSPSIALYIDRVLQEVAASSASTAELVVNGGFESSTGSPGTLFNGGWTDTSTGTAVSALPGDGTHGLLAPRTGSYCTRLTGTLGCNGFAKVAQDLTAIGGRSLTVEAYGYSAGSRTLGVSLQNLSTGNYYNGSTNAWEASEAFIGTSAAGAWTLMTETLTVEGSAGSSQTLRLELSCYFSSSGTVYFDDVSAVIDTGGVSMTETSPSNFDFGSAAGSDLLRGQIRKIHSYQDVLTPTEMQRQI